MNRVKMYLFMYVVPMQAVRVELRVVIQPCELFLSLAAVLERPLFIFLARFN